MLAKNKSTMELIKALLGLLWKLALMCFAIAFIAGVVTIFLPQYTATNIINSFKESFLSSSKLDNSSDQNDDKNSPAKEKKVGKSWLPAPGSFSLLGKAKTPDENTNLYVSDGPYISSPAYGTNNSITNDSNYDKRELYLRNLSLPPYGYIYAGMTITGEAKENMFAGEIFPLVIVDDKGNSGVIGQAKAITNWAIPGWIKFEAKITSRLPSNVPCTLIFYSQDVQPIMGKRIKIAYPVQCH